MSGNSSYATLRDESKDQKSPQVPLAAYHIERPVEVNVGAKHDDVEIGPWASP